MNFDRRKFLHRGGQFIGAAMLGGAAWRVFAGKDPESEFSQPTGPYVWRINPDKCNYCGLCETACVRKPSAVKAVNDQTKCSYCVACYGHLADLAVPSELIDSQGVKVCPYDAVIRKEFAGGTDGYHLYTIDQAKCTACGKCAKRCNELGTKSMFMIIRPDLCIGCNRCSIMAVCPKDAVARAHSYPEDDYRGIYELDHLLNPQPGGGKSGAES